MPLEKRNDQLNDIISWLGFVVRSVDSSLVDEWAAAGEDATFDAAPPSEADVVVADRRGMTLLVRSLLFPDAPAEELSGFLLPLLIALGLLLPLMTGISAGICRLARRRMGR